MARKRKKGPRTRSGRLSRAKAYLFDRGTERAQLRQQLFGTDWADPIGRAYRAGLLGENAKERIDAARAFSRSCQMFSVGRVKSCLGLDINGQSTNHDMISPAVREKIIERERRTIAALKAIDRMGRQHRRAFDQLVLTAAPDGGPLWLDRLIEAKRSGGAFLPQDRSMLKMAIEALDEVIARMY